jgi:membrane associated rhomboid family serine protease
MIIPQRDVSRPLSQVPVATMTIIALNVVMFIVELVQGDSFVLRYSLKAAEIVRGEHLETLFTSMFMHASITHILGNMVYLYAFGNGLEANYLGPGRFTLFYLVCGLAASFAQIAVGPTSTVPNLGASGAIAGVLGGFMLVFPNDQILVAVFALFRIWSARISAAVLIGLWFLLQLFSGVGSIVSPSEASQASSGVAYFAHIGGFIAGVVLVRLFNIGNASEGDRL